MRKLSVISILALGIVAETALMPAIIHAADLFVTSNNEGIGEYTTSGATVNGSLVSGVSDPTGIAVVGSDIFIGSLTSGTIAEYTTSGTLVNASLISGLHPYGVAASGSDLFVTTLDGTVGEYTTSGATVNAALVSGLNNVGCIAVSGSDLFVVDGERVGEYTTSGATVNATLVSGLVDNPFAIAVSGSDLFVDQGKYNAASIGEYTISGATVNATLVSGLLNPYGIAVSGSDLFVGLFEHDGEVGEYSTTGAPVNVSLIPDVGGIPFGIALGTGAGTAVVPLPPAAWTILAMLGGLFAISVMRNRVCVA